VNPTWVRFDGTYLWLTATTSRRKHRNWQVQPAVALSIIDPDRPHRYLEIRGRVERIVPDPEAAEFLRLAERYSMPQPGPPPMPRTASPSRSARSIPPPSDSFPGQAEDRLRRGGAALGPVMIPMLAVRPRRPGESAVDAGCAAQLVVLRAGRLRRRRRRRRGTDHSRCPACTASELDTRAVTCGLAG
jgi:hypothetical protein